MAYVFICIVMTCSLLYVYDKMMSSPFTVRVICNPYCISSRYLVLAEVWVHDEHVTGSPQTALFISSTAEMKLVVVISGLHRDQPEESAVVRTTGAEGQFLCRVGGQNMTSVTAQTHTVMHDLVGHS